MAQDNERPTPVQDGANRREFYRIAYPVVDRPAFTAGAVRGRVIDCSQTGARVSVDLLPEDVTITVGERMTATLRLFSGAVVEVGGEAVRWDGRTLVLRFDRRGIPFRDILREQWTLRQKYPWREEP